MGCRIGMATNVEERVVELMDEGKIPEDCSWHTLHSGLNYDQATQKEEQERRACGPQCDGRAGGARESGYEWSVYRIDW